MNLEPRPAYRRSAARQATPQQRAVAEAHHAIAHCLSFFCTACLSPRRRHAIAAFFAACFGCSKRGLVSIMTMCLCIAVVCIVALVWLLSEVHARRTAATAAVVDGSTAALDDVDPNTGLSNTEQLREFPHMAAAKRSYLMFNDDTEDGQPHPLTKDARSQWWSDRVSPAENLVVRRYFDFRSYDLHAIVSPAEEATGTSTPLTDPRGIARLLPALAHGGAPTLPAVRSLLEGLILRRLNATELPELSASDAEALLQRPSDWAAVFHHHFGAHGLGGDGETVRGGRRGRSCHRRSSEIAATILDAARTEAAAQRNRAALASTYKGAGPTDAELEAATKAVVVEILKRKVTGPPRTGDTNNNENLHAPAVDLSVFKAFAKMMTAAVLSRDAAQFTDCPRGPEAMVEGVLLRRGLTMRSPLFPPGPWELAEAQAAAGEATSNLRQRLVASEADLSKMAVDDLIVSGQKLQTALLNAPLEQRVWAALQASWRRIRGDAFRGVDAAFREQLLTAARALERSSFAKKPQARAPETAGSKRKVQAVPEPTQQPQKAASHGTAVVGGKAGAVAQANVGAQANRMFNVPKPTAAAPWPRGPGFSAPRAALQHVSSDSAWATQEYASSATWRSWLSLSERAWYRAALEETMAFVPIVYTWVNGSDTVHLKQKAVHRRQPIAKADGGDRDSGELAFSVRSVLQHMRWHKGRVVFITPGSVPSWLRLDHPRVSVIHQDALTDDILERTSHNSNAFEPMLYRVPGVDITDPVLGYYLHFNDDYMVAKDTTLESFFTFLEQPDDLAAEQDAPQHSSTSAGAHSSVPTEEPAMQSETFKTSPEFKPTVSDAKAGVFSSLFDGMVSSSTKKRSVGRSAVRRGDMASPKHSIVDEAYYSAFFEDATMDDITVPSAWDRNSWQVNMLRRDVSNGVYRDQRTGSDGADYESPGDGLTQPTKKKEWFGAAKRVLRNVVGLPQPTTDAERRESRRRTEFDGLLVRHRTTSLEHHADAALRLDIDPSKRFVNPSFDRFLRQVTVRPGGILRHEQSQAAFNYSFHKSRCSAERRNWEASVYNTFMQVESKLGGARPMGPNGVGRYFVKHAPFVYCAPMARGVYHAFQTDFKTGARAHKFRATDDVLFPFAYNTIATENPEILAQNQTLRFRRGRAAASDRTAATHAAGLSDALHTHVGAAFDEQNPTPVLKKGEAAGQKTNTDGHGHDADKAEDVPPRFYCPKQVARVTGSEAIYFQVENNATENEKRFQSVRQRDPLLFNVNDRLSTWEAAAQMQRFLMSYFPYFSEFEIATTAAAKAVPTPPEEGDVPGAMWAPDTRFGTSGRALQSVTGQGDTDKAAKGPNPLAKVNAIHESQASVSQKGAPSGPPPNAKLHHLLVSSDGGMEEPLKASTTTQRRVLGAPPSIAERQKQEILRRTEPRRLRGRNAADGGLGRKPLPLQEDGHKQFAAGMPQEPPVGLLPVTFSQDAVLSTADVVLKVTSMDAVCQAVRSLDTLAMPYSSGRVFVLVVSADDQPTTSDTCPELRGREHGKGHSSKKGHSSMTSKGHREAKAREKSRLTGGHNQATERRLQEVSLTNRSTMRGRMSPSTPVYFASTCAAGLSVSRLAPNRARLTPKVHVIDLRPLAMYAAVGNAVKRAAKKAHQQGPKTAAAEAANDTTTVFVPTAAIRAAEIAAADRLVTDFRRRYGALTTLDSALSFLCEYRSRPLAFSLRGVHGDGVPPRSAWGAVSRSMRLPSICGTEVPRRPMVFVETVNPVFGQAIMREHLTLRHGTDGFSIRVASRACVRLVLRKHSVASLHRRMALLKQRREILTRWAERQWQEEAVLRASTKRGKALAKLHKGHGATDHMDLGDTFAVKHAVKERQRWVRLLTSLDPNDGNYGDDSDDFAAVKDGYNPLKEELDRRSTAHREGLPVLGLSVASTGDFLASYPFPRDESRFETYH